MRFVCLLSLVASLCFTTVCGVRRGYAMPPHAGFQSCGYKSGAWKLAQATSALIGSIQSIGVDAVYSRADGIARQISAINSTFGSGRNAHARQAEAALRQALQQAKQAADGYNLGISDLYSTSLKQAWAQMAIVWKALNPLCPLGHPSHVQEDVSADGRDYSDGIGAFPVSQPWLSVPQSWILKWSYNCTGRPYGFKVEVRSIGGGRSLAMSGSGVYLGPLRTVAVNQHGRLGAATQRMSGIPGTVYMVVRSQCQFSLKVTG